MLSETLQVITQVAMLVFVVGSMAAMGLGLTVARIAQPLRDVRLVVALLVVELRRGARSPPSPRRGCSRWNPPPRPPSC